MSSRSGKGLAKPAFPTALATGFTLLKLETPLLCSFAVAISQLNLLISPRQRGSRKIYPMNPDKIAKLKKWDIQEHLNTPEDIALYLEAVFEDGDPKLIAAALGDIARSKGMTQVAKDAGLSRESLYKALSVNGDPRLTTLVGVFKALGLKLSATAAE